MPRRAIKLVYEWMDLHNKELLRNWEATQKQEALNKIEPLK